MRSRRMRGKTMIALSFGAWSMYSGALARCDLDRWLLIDAMEETGEHEVQRVLYRRLRDTPLHTTAVN